MQYNKEVFVDVAVPLLINDLFTYQVPIQYSDKIKVGSRVLVSLRRKKIIGIVFKVFSNTPEINNLKCIDSVLESDVFFSPNYLKFYKWLSNYYCFPLGGVLNSAIFIDYRKKHIIKKNTINYFMLNSRYNLESAISQLNQSRKSPVQEKFLLFFFAVKNKYHLVRDVRKNGFNNKIFNELLKKNIIKICNKENIKISNKIYLNKLSSLQLKVYRKIIHNFNETQKPVLLHGVTGSGKTEIYKHLIYKSLKSGKSVLYMLPEIALTNQIFTRLKDSFNDRVIVYHSSISLKSKKDIWNRVVSETDNLIVLGTRSSLFLPFNNLGLIIVDEEHDHSYKQSIKPPFYNARDSAIYLSKLLKINIIIGSATPSIESYYNTQIGKYILCELTSRFGGVKMPIIHFIDMSLIRKDNLIDGFLSKECFNKIKSTLINKKQVILFVNRRGYNSYQSCFNCGHVTKCIHCDVSLTYHKGLNKLKCHYCSYAKKVEVICKSCGSNNIRLMGFGTEKIEHILSKYFSTKTIRRMDFDSTRVDGEYHNIITAFENREIDILIGTQMLSKGLDFENLGLVCVLNTDSLFYYPEFRCNERAFQLLSQVAGRSGRVDQGEVVIQSFDVNHKVFEHIEQNNYTSFFESELLSRKKYYYPPFSRLICIQFKCRSKSILDQSSLLYAKVLSDKFQVKFLGPEYPIKSKLSDSYFKSIYIKMNKKYSLNKMSDILISCKKHILSFSRFKSVSILIDVDSA